MPTLHAHRIIIIAPVAKAVTLAADLNTGLGANTVPADLGPGLSANGTAPATHNWCGIALVDGGAKQVLSRLCTLAGRPLPTAAQWNNATPAQKRTWWASVRAAAYSNYGVYCALAANDGVWDSPDAALAAVGLKTVGAAVTV